MMEAGLEHCPQPRNINGSQELGQSKAQLLGTLLLLEATQSAARWGQHWETNANWE